MRAAAQGRGFEEDLVLAGCVRGSSLEPEARSACQMWQRRLGSGHGHVQEVEKNSIWNGLEKEKQERRGHLSLRAEYQ